MEWARERGVRVIGYYLSSSVEECQTRNSLRDEKSRVPDVGFFTILRDLERPHFDEGFDELYFVKSENGVLEVEDWREE